MKHKVLNVLEYQNGNTYSNTYTHTSMYMQVLTISNNNNNDDNDNDKNSNRVMSEGGIVVYNFWVLHLDKLMNKKIKESIGNEYIQ